MTDDVDRPREGSGAARRLLAGGLKALAALVVLVGVPVAGCFVLDATASSRAEQARDALRVGITCAEFVSIAKRFANDESAKEARDSCAAASAKTVTLNFSHGMSLN